MKYEFQCQLPISNLQKFNRKNQSYQHAPDLRVNCVLSSTWNSSSMRPQRKFLSRILSTIKFPISCNFGTNRKAWKLQRHLNLCKTNMFIKLKKRWTSYKMACEALALKRKKITYQKIEQEYLDIKSYGIETQAIAKTFEKNDACLH